MQSPVLALIIFTHCLLVSSADAGGLLCELGQHKPTLEELYDSDQGSRKGTAPANDIGNRHRLRQIVSECGWPSAAIVGRKAAMGAFLVLQHAPLDMQIEYLPLLRKAEERGRLAPGTLPYLEDRILVRQGKPQRFGTQFSAHCQLYEISEPESVDHLREAAGLVPLEEYLEYGLERASGQ